MTILHINRFIIQIKIYFLNSRYNYRFEIEMLLAGVRRSGKQEAVPGRMNGGRGEYIRESKKDNAGRGVRKEGIHGGEDCVGIYPHV